jgi:hypothetical protein
MRSEQSWSQLDPKPILLYLPNLDEYIVYWNTVAMTHSQALCMAMTTLGIYPTPQQKQAMQQNYLKIYHAGGFGHQRWDQIIQLTQGNVYGYLCKKMQTHVMECTKQISPDQLLEWFDYGRARTLGHDSAAG